jgi:hypothetical protein
MVPATKGDMEEMQRAQEAFTGAAIASATSGNEAGAAVYSTLAGLAATLLTIGLSRKRRAEAALLQATGTKKIPSLGNPLGVPASGPGPSLASS